MDITKWNLDEAKIVWYMESFEEGLEKGREEARKKAREEGWEEVFEENLEKARAKDSELINRAAARYALAKGLPLEAIQNMTGLDLETLNTLKG